MSRERTPVGNILALDRTKNDQAKDVEEAATSYMPTNVDLETLMPDGGGPETQSDASMKSHEPHGIRRQEGNPRHGRTPSHTATPSRADKKRKRISLYLDDDVLTKIFRVSLESHEQLSTATHRLILEALKARGL